MHNKIKPIYDVKNWFHVVSSINLVMFCKLATHKLWIFFVHNWAFILWTEQLYSVQYASNAVPRFVANICDNRIISQIKGINIFCYKVMLFSSHNTFVISQWWAKKQKKKLLLAQVEGSNHHRMVRSLQYGKFDLRLS